MFLALFLLEHPFPAIFNLLLIIHGCTAVFTLIQLFIVGYMYAGTTLIIYYIVLSVFTIIMKGFNSLYSIIVPEFIYLSRRGEFRYTKQTWVSQSKLSRSAAAVELSFYLLTNLHFMFGSPHSMLFLRIHPIFNLHFSFHHLINCRSTAALSLSLQSVFCTIFSFFYVL